MLAPEGGVFVRWGKGAITDIGEKCEILHTRLQVVHEPEDNTLILRLEITPNVINSCIFFFSFFLSLFNWLF